MILLNINDSENVTVFDTWDGHFCIIHLRSIPSNADEVFELCIY